MKKMLIYILIILLLTSSIIYIFAPQITSFFLSMEIKTPVSINYISYKNKTINIRTLKIKNIEKTNPQEALFIKKIDVHAPISNFFKKELIIDKINLKKCDLNLIYYNKSGTENNWSQIIKLDPKEKKSEKSYLIKKLVIENLNVTLYEKNGKKKSYPEIKRLVINNISSDSGFPYNQIEKAIFAETLKSVFNILNLRHLIKSLNPTNLIPKTFKMIPFVGINIEKKEN